MTNIDFWLYFLDDLELLARAAFRCAAANVLQSNIFVVTHVRILAFGTTHLLE